MNVLLFDLGNSRWKAAYFDGKRLGPVTVGRYEDSESLRQVSTGAQRALLASVASPDRLVSITELVAGIAEAQIDTVKATDRMPNVRSGYRKPEQLGVDRLLAMVAARALCTAPLCVIDAGTAVTMDFVDASGQHLGGFILPGLQMHRDCLLANTSIPRDSEAHPSDTLGRDTPTAVAQGARYAVAGIVDMFLNGAAALFEGQTAKVIIGGGDAGSLVPLLPSPCQVVDHLVLQGLAEYARAGS